MMGTEIYKIDASWAEKLTKKRVQFLMTPTVTLERALARISILFPEIEHMGTFIHPQFHILNLFKYYYKYCGTWQLSTRNSSSVHLLPIGCLLILIANAS